MPDTPAPQLLSDQQVEELLMANAGQQGAAETAMQLGAPLAKPLLASTQRVDVLLADRTAYRLAVAEQLRGLLTDPEAMDNLFDKRKDERTRQNNRVSAAAKALDIEL